MTPDVALKEFSSKLIWVRQSPSRVQDMEKVAPWLFECGAEHLLLPLRFHVFYWGDAQATMPRHRSTTLYHPSVSADPYRPQLIAYYNLRFREWNVARGQLAESCAQ